MIRNYKYKCITLVVIFISFVFVMVTATKARNDFKQSYDKGKEQLESGNIEEAISYFSEIPDCANYLDIRELLENEGVDFCPSCGHILSDEYDELRK